jgi:hypothetical protein
MYESLDEARREVAACTAAIERGENVKENRQAIQDAMEWIEEAVATGDINVSTMGRIQ